jgi:hypothetical protein
MVLLVELMLLLYNFMKSDIKMFILSVNRRYGTECLYFSDNDVYSIRFKGRAVQNFNSEKFYSLPKRNRFNMIRSIIKLGLAHNIGERSLRNQIYLDRKIGRIVK